ncbi:hypothetical protein VTK73DRAFT_4981 [Phialemonium thermophilum]|uniref:Zn(2)-C6 fungal-type domain-containing protein n=1 Tax=Phialemonium thermophilum TaxID=223376 RepID=A0ABR3XYT8_9PEZI
MAVVAPPPLNSNLDLWGPSESAIYPAVAPESMTDVMPYQYPPPPTAQNGADMELPPSGYIPNYSISQGSSGVDMGPSPDSNLSLDESQETSSKAMKMKQAMSSPGARSSQMQQSPPHHGAMQDQNALAMGGEKRRNKLGYHRTSVACGHCRRRKIRCIPSPADVQGRCVNCIRLKKECSFYPVDQQPPQDTRQKSSSRSSVGPKIASASSSPAMQTGLPSDMQGHHTYAQMSMAPIPNMAPPMKPSAANSLPPEAKVVPSASTGRGYEYAQGVTNWMSADPAVSKPGDLNATWRSYPAESPITPAFSPYTPHAPGPAATWAAGVSGEAAARDDMHWSSYSAPPARSMSFGAESMTGHHQQYPPIAEMSSHSSRSYSRGHPPHRVTSHGANRTLIQSRVTLTEFGTGNMAHINRSRLEIRHTTPESSHNTAPVSIIPNDKIIRWMQREYTPP